MKDMGIQQGSETWAKDVIVTDDIVYVHEDIEEITNEDGSTVYQYHEYQYSPSEYIEKQSEEISNLEEQDNSMQDALDYLMFGE